MDAPTEAINRVKFRAMGTQVELAAIPEPYHSFAEIEEAFSAAKRRIAYLEQRLSRFDPKSDVTYINTQSGRFVRVSVETVAVVELALEAYRVSQGLFCPWMGEVIEQLGYDVSFENIDEPSGGRAGVGASRRLRTIPPRDFTAGQLPLYVEPEENLVRIDTGYHLDLGGLAKGWIVEQVVNEFTHRGFRNIVVNAGGDLVCRGKQPGGPWTVGIVNPWDESDSLFKLDVENLAMATSGTYRRRWQSSHGEVHHLLDPRTGRPSDSDVVSCSVLASRLTGAEVLAKTALLLGKEQGMRWLEKQPQRGYVIITREKEVFHAWNSSMNAKSRQ
ncbi:FAD:protein FMN transferase [Alicyclobacillus curvatus]|jgi:FAD:protein FMN transferase|nr:FAD:protein FMN transferase [Alicyclobacillus curvatus]